jgi:hypothetical protein
MRRPAILTAMILIMVTPGWASYYKVTDPATGKEYYTDAVEREGGSVTFQDVNTHATVTLPTSEVMEISKNSDR